MPLEVAYKQWQFYLDMGGFAMKKFPLWKLTCQRMKAGRFFILQYLRKRSICNKPVCSLPKEGHLALLTKQWWNFIQTNFLSNIIWSFLRQGRGPWRINAANGVRLYNGFCFSLWLFNYLTGSWLQLVLSLSLIKEVQRWVGKKLHLIKETLILG